MHTSKYVRRCMAIALTLGLLSAFSGASAGVLFAGGDTGTGDIGFGGLGLFPGDTPKVLLAGRDLLEVKAVSYGPSGGPSPGEERGNIYVLEGSEPGQDGGSDQEFVYEYDPNGQFLGTFVPYQTYAGLSGGEAKHMTFGPDGNLYIAVHELSGGVGEAVFRFNGQTGAFIDVFVDSNDDGPNVDFDEPSALLFSPAGDLYVAQEDGILRFSSTGTLLGEAIDGTSEALWNESKGMAWRNGRLFVANNDDDNVLVVDFNPDGSTSNVSQFAVGGGMNEPTDVGFGPDGFLYVLSEDEVLRFDANSGALVDVYLDLRSLTDQWEDPYGFIFFFEDTEIPVMSPWAMALLALGLVGLAGLVLVRRRTAQAS